MGCAVAERVEGYNPPAMWWREWGDAAATDRPRREAAGQGESVAGSSR
jgi:hypothetical protein